jgi:acyl-CoA thioesterase YciA
MDIAGGIVAAERAQGRVATIGVEAMTFHKPVLVGDVVSCYCAIARVGRTSLSVQVEIWVRRGRTGEEVKVTEGRFTYVAIDEARKPRPVPG